MMKNENLVAKRALELIRNESLSGKEYKKNLTKTIKVLEEELTKIQNKNIDDKRAEEIKNM